MQEQFEQMLSWTARAPSGTKLGKPYISNRNGILELHFNRLSVQSEMDIDNPDELVLSYTRTMMSFLLFNPAPEHITMIGLGGGSLVKYCYRHLPDTEITVVEIDPNVISLRDEFAIPPDDARFKVLLGDGAAFVKAPHRALQILMVDGFNAGGQPSQLGSQSFYDNCFDALADDGMMVVNLWGSSDEYDDYLHRIKTSFANRVVVISVDDNLNKIVLAAKSADFSPSPAAIRQNADLLCTAHPLNFQAKSNKLIRAIHNKISVRDFFE